MSTSATSKEYRSSNGIFFRIEGEGEPLLLLHGLMATGAMFDPLIKLLRDRFRMLIPDLRGHGKSGDLDGPYDVAALTADLDIVLAEARFDRSAVMGYSQQMSYPAFGTVNDPSGSAGYLRPRLSATSGTSRRIRCLWLMLTRGLPYPRQSAHPKRFWECTC
jgi:hypothetical protein